MASLFIVPTFESLPSSSRGSCQPECLGSTLSHGPVRHRTLYRRRWSPFESSPLSRFLELAAAEDVRDFTDNTDGLENLWRLPLLLSHLRDRRSAKKESDCSANQSAEKDKQASEKAGKNISPADENRSDKFRVSVELGDAFEPNEISVKVVGKSLKVEGKHEETGEDGHFSCRQFTRSFYLSDDVDIENLTSALSKEGVLSVEAPRLQLKEKESEERNIPIQQTTSPEAVEAEKPKEAEKGEEEKTNPEEREKDSIEPTENELHQPKENENFNKD